MSAQTFDNPVERLLARLERVTPMGAGFTGSCPAHDDSHNSLKVDRGDQGEALVHCHAGCSIEDVIGKLGLTLRDLYPPRTEAVGRTGGAQRKRGEGVHTPPRNTATLQHDGLTLARYAEAKQLDPERLRAFGLADAPYFQPPAIRLTYRDESGGEAAVRFRLCLDKSPDGDDRFKWRKGSKLCLYGRDRLRLAHERGFIALVEGESDCHTLWSYNQPAVGVPGATNWNDARDAPLLEGIPTIYVVIERDLGGEAVLKWLAASAIRDRVQLVDLAPFNVKDPSALHCDDPGQFAKRWQAALDAAVPLSERLDDKAIEDAEAAWDACRDLARGPAILHRAATTVAALGVAGERSAVELVFLAMVSRLLPRPVNVAVKGPSSGGKSYLVEQTLRLFPVETFYALTAMSERALAYSDEPLTHRMLVLYEAAGQTGDIGSYLMRSLLSEGRIRYETVEKTKDGLRAKLIERAGPTGLIVTTTATRLHPENETRMVSITVSDTQDQTRAIFLALANGHGTEPDLAPWHALQRWLALGERRVDVPFAEALATLMPPKAVRLRRDFGLLLTLIRAHALLHCASRGRSENGTILATLDDYEAVRILVEPLIAAGVDATVPASMRETVTVVRDLCPGPDETTSLATIAKKLGLDKSAASRRVSAARERGYLINHETRKGQPARIGIGDALPENEPILPDRCSVAVLFEGIDPPPPPAQCPDSADQQPPQPMHLNGHAPTFTARPTTIRVPVA